MQKIFIYIAITGGILTLLVFGLVKWEKNIEQRGYNKAQAEYVEQAIQQQERQRKIDIVSAERQKGIEHGYQEKIKQLEVDANNAKSAVDRLRIQVASYRNQTVSRTAIASDSPPTDIIAELFIKSVERYRELAKESDINRESALACEQSYDTVREAINSL